MLLTVNCLLGGDLGLHVYLHVYLHVSPRPSAWYHLGEYSQRNETLPVNIPLIRYQLRKREPNPKGHEDMSSALEVEVSLGKVFFPICGKMV